MVFLMYRIIRKRTITYNCYITRLLFLVIKKFFYLFISEIRWESVSFQVHIIYIEVISLIILFIQFLISFYALISTYFPFIPFHFRVSKYTISSNEVHFTEYFPLLLVGFFIQIYNWLFYKATCLNKCRISFLEK